MKNGEIYTWGRGYRGCLGLGTDDSQFAPMLVEFHEALYPCITKISAGASHTIALDQQGRVYTFGSNGK